LGFFGRAFGYGGKLPKSVRKILAQKSEQERHHQSYKAQAEIVIQLIGGFLLILALGFHVASVGLIGLSLLVVLTTFNGVIDAEPLGDAFLEALPFAALLTVFFGIAAIIDHNNLFHNVVLGVVKKTGKERIASLYFLEGFIAALCDNVFVATVQINEIHKAWVSGAISREDLNILAVTTNVATNIPSIATPNGQAAFLFLYTSALAPLIRLNYCTMVRMALPYLITMGVTSVIITVNLKDFTASMVNVGWLTQA